MGLLDDAIREHLDLKRRRGADPAEVERMEREALGPVRRGPAPLEPGADPDMLDDRDALRVADAGYGDPAGPGAPYPDDDEGYAARAAGDAADGGELAASLEPPYRSSGSQGELEDSVRPVEFQPRSIRERLTRRDAPEAADEGWDETAPESDAAELGSLLPAAPTPSEAAPREFDAPPSLGQETVEYSTVGDQEQLEGEDMLEETPEFLQDTPDHDRLWFEQRPPRDFDFDE